MRHHAVEIDLGLKLLGLAAEHRDVGDARDSAQTAFDHPVLQRLQLGERYVRGALELIAHDLADAAGRRDHGLHPGGERHVLQAVERLLAHEVIVAPIFELQADEAKRIHGVGA